MSRTPRPVTDCDSLGALGELMGSEGFRAAAGECARRERARQGLPAMIEDPAVAARVRGLLAFGG